MGTEPKLIVHGGAWDIPDEHVDAHMVGVRAAVEAVHPELLRGMSALDAVQAAVNVLEEDPTFDAGRGAFLNADGEIELDAMIMDGDRLDFGAVAAVRNILHPVDVARRIMGADDVRFLVGEGAMRFAREQGVPEVDPETLLTEREKQYYRKAQRDPSFSVKGAFGPTHPVPSDTVGAVALDSRGRLAAATSTGGTPRKRPGRVGDCPLPGAGTWADGAMGAASATGYGESIMRVLLTREACGLIGTRGPMEAARAAVAMLKERVDGLGGVILLSPSGEFGMAHNTPRMAHALAGPGGIEAHIRCG